MLIAEAASDAVRVIVADVQVEGAVGVTCLLKDRGRLASHAHQVARAAFLRNLERIQARRLHVQLADHRGEVATVAEQARQAAHVREGVEVVRHVGVPELPAGVVV